MTAQFTKFPFKRSEPWSSPSHHAEDIARALRQHLAQSRTVKGETPGAASHVAEKLRQHVDSRVITAQQEVRAAFPPERGLARHLG